MLIQQIDMAKTHWWNATALAYTTQDQRLAGFYRYTPDLEGISKAISERQFPEQQRARLVRILQQQYADAGITLEPGSAVQQNIDALLKPNTFTVTAGQQVHIFLGPLFFLYKIITTIQLAQEASRANPGSKVVPVFWMATEDHDLEEINHITLFGQRYTWEPGLQGPVGRMPVDGIITILDQLKQKFGSDTRAAHMLGIFEKAYVSGHSLSAATRIVLHKLFETEGLIVIDPDDEGLKQEFMPVMEKELTLRGTEPLVTAQTALLEQAGFAGQAHPRPINLFYMENGLRERLVYQDDKYQVLNTDLTFTERELLNKLHNNAGNFSPNVILRPIYQETILPNVAYVPGGSELIYWLQVKPAFDAYSVGYPVVWVRKSAAIVYEKQLKTIEEQGLTLEQLFAPEADLKELFAARSGKSSQGSEVIAQVNTLYQQAFQEFRKAGLSFKELVGDVNKQLGQMNLLFKQVDEYYLQREQGNLEKILQLRSQVFNPSSPQERTNSAVSIWCSKGESLVSQLLSVLDINSRMLNIIKW